MSVKLNFFMRKTVLVVLCGLALVAGLSLWLLWPQSRPLAHGDGGVAATASVPPPARRPPWRRAENFLRAQHHQSAGVPPGEHHQVHRPARSQAARDPAGRTR